MEKAFFSDKNINNQTIKFMQTLGIKPNQQAVDKCRIFVKKQMNNGYKEYSEKKPNSMSSQDFFDKLNTLCLKDALASYEIKRKKSIGTNMDKFSRTRDEEVFGQREQRLPPRGRYTNQKQANDGAKPRYSEAGGSSFASFNTDDVDNGYVDATGQIIRGNGFMVSSGNERDSRNNSGSNGDSRIGMMSSGKGSADELARRMLELKNDYSGNVRRIPPTEINFCVDGGDTRGSGPSSGQNGNMDFDKFEQFQGMDSFNGGDNFGSNFNGNSDNNDNFMDFMNNSGNQSGGNSGNMNQMQQMMMKMFQMMQNQSSNSNQQPILDDTADAKTRLSRLMNERSSIDSMAKNNQTGGKFDPMKSPYDKNPFFFEQGKKIIETLTNKDLQGMNVEQLEFLNSLYGYVFEQNKKIKQQKKLDSKIPIKGATVNLENKHVIFDSSHYFREDNYGVIEFPGDITIEFEKPIPNTVRLGVTKAKFPAYTETTSREHEVIERNHGFCETINEYIYTFAIKFSDDEEYRVYQIDKGNYTLKSLIEELHTNFKADEIDLTLRINNRRKIEIFSNNKTKFSLKYYPDSILRMLGFINKEYNGSDKYVSEESPDLDMYQAVDVYLCSENHVIMDQPLFTYNLVDGDTNKLPVHKEIPKQTIRAISLKLTAHNHKDIMYTFPLNFKLKIELLHSEPK